MATEQTDRVLELVVFTLKGGTTRDQVLGTVDAVSEWVRTQPGFLSRELTHAADEDKWVEILYWRSMEEAKAAGAAAETSADCAPMFSLIDMDTMLFLHAVPVLQTATA